MLVLCLDMYGKLVDRFFSVPFVFVLTFWGCILCHYVVAFSVLCFFADLILSLLCRLGVCGVVFVLLSVLMGRAEASVASM